MTTQPPNTVFSFREYNPPLADRIKNRLFPRSFLPVIPNGHITGLPPWAKDAIHIEVKCDLSFLDRLRVLFTGKLRVEIRTCTAEPPGRCETHAVSYPTI